jgi:undecaprenyl-diphosphatase
MPLIHTVILGIIQGITEFLPISSSAHLVVLPWFAHWHYQGLAYDVMLHLGTLIAVVIYFFKDWVSLTKNGLTNYKSEEGRRFWLLVVATLPAAIIGFFFENIVETTFRNPAYIAVNLIVFAILLAIADRKKATESPKSFTLKAAIIIGIAQAISIFPGVSRSGVTITAGLFLGLSRTDSTRISFLMSTPIIFGATIMAFRQVGLADLNAPFFVGVATSAITGLFAIRFLMSFIKKFSFSFFAIYRIILGNLIFIRLLF